jgi:hypothetical protein
MKPKVYIETTIPSYLAARPTRDLIVAAHLANAMMAAQSAQVCSEAGCKCPVICTPEALLEE